MHSKCKRQMHDECKAIAKWRSITNAEQMCKANASQMHSKCQGQMHDECKAIAKWRSITNAEQMCKANA